MSQLLQAGVNDVGGTLNGENISRAAGAKHGQMLTEKEFANICKPLGRRLIERSTLYRPIRERTLSSSRTVIPIAAEY